MATIAIKSVKEEQYGEGMPPIGHGTHGPRFPLNHSWLSRGLTDCQQFASKLGARVFHLPFSLTTTHSLCSVHLRPSVFDPSYTGGQGVVDVRDHAHHIPIVFVFFFSLIDALPVRG